MLKHQIRKKILKIRDEKYYKSLNIDKKKFLKLFKKLILKNQLLVFIIQLILKLAQERLWSF